MVSPRPGRANAPARASSLFPGSNAAGGKHYCVSWSSSSCFFSVPLVLSFLPDFFDYCCHAENGRSSPGNWIDGVTDRSSEVVYNIVLKQTIHRPQTAGPDHGGVWAIMVARAVPPIYFLRTSRRLC